MTIDDFIILAEKALSGDASSQFKLGRCFTFGDVVNTDYSQDSSYNSSSLRVPSG